MAASITITPSVLTWARERAGYRQEDSAFPKLAAWEQGSASPTYRQLEALAKKYSCSLAVFFFPAPPHIDPIERTFRTLPESDIASLSPHIIKMMRKATAYQLNIAELIDGKRLSEHFLLEEITYDHSASVAANAERLRQYLNIPIEEQKEWADADKAFKAWRGVLESRGIFVFKDAFRDDKYSGFCLYDKQYPLICINNSTTKYRQIFTLFHELAHLLFRVSGVVREDDEEFIEALDVEETAIEQLCNQFSAAFLLPEDCFSTAESHTALTDEQIGELSDTYKVSREVILRKLLDKGRITSREYKSRRDHWYQHFKVSGQKAKKSGGDYYATRNIYLSEPYVSMVLKAYHQSRISNEIAGQYLNIKPRSLETFEARTFPLRLK